MTTQGQGPCGSASFYLSESSLFVNIYIEFRKMLMITLYAEQKKRHRFIEQSFRLCGRRRGRDVSREQH